MRKGEDESVYEDVEDTFISIILTFPPATVIMHVDDV